MRIDAAWRAGARNVLAVMPTGAGKTKVFAHKVASYNGAAIAIAHRSELVSQMSQAFAREGVRHRVIGASGLQRLCTQLQMEEFGRSFVDPNSRAGVASVDTLIGMPPATPWFAQVGRWIQDEAHHVLEENKWGKACELFPNAYGLGVTATPTRADGKGLGRHAEGLFDEMVIGPGMRELITRGYLCDYKIYAPPSDLDLSNVTVTATGDYSPEKLKAARRRSTVTGDVVKHYLRLARGKRGITFDTDVESATETAAAYRNAGVPAEVVSGKTPDGLRANIMRRFKAGELLQLVNCDLFGEGTDVPAVEVVSMARPTQSYGLYVQQFGRALRILAGKTHAIIIDHVDNVHRHGLPDAYREWSLNSRERSSRGKQDGAIPLTTCRSDGCFQVYERVLVSCPYCGHRPEVADRSAPKFVDGDLVELDPATLARLRGEAEAIHQAPNLHGVPEVARNNFLKYHDMRQHAQVELGRVIATWAGWQQHQGRGDQESYRRFYFQFGTDVATAQTLKTADATALADRIRNELSRANVKGIYE